MVPDEVADVGDVLGKKGGGSTLDKNVEPSDCNCKIQITGITSNYSMPTWQWRFSDLTGVLGMNPSQTESQLIVHGNGSAWYKPGVGLIDLPTDFLNLDPYNAGCHKFDFWLKSGPVADEDVILYTKVICCDGGGDCTEETASTITTHEFTVPAGNGRVQLWKLFSCWPIIAGDESDCAVLQGGSDF